MNRNIFIIKNKIFKTGFCLLALLFAFTIFSNNAVYAKEIQAYVLLPVSQEFIVKNAVSNTLDKTGKYELTAMKKDCPMPSGSQDGKYIFTIEDTVGQTTIPLTYVHGGVYRYQLQQTTREAENYTYDRTCYTINVYIKNGESGQLIPQIIVTNEQGEKCEEIMFQNSYTGKVIPNNEIKKTEGGNLQSNDSPRTGDIANIGVWLGVMLVALACILGVVAMQKKSNK